MTDTPQVLLAHHLKTLKLPTFLREYDKLARQCATEGDTYLNFSTSTGTSPPAPAAIVMACTALPAARKPLSPAGGTPFAEGLLSCGLRRMLTINSKRGLSC